MIKKLPGSSDATALDIYRLQKQCDWVRAENQLQSIDQQDQEVLSQLILEIASSNSERLNGREANRFSDPKLIGLGAFGLVFSCQDCDQGDKQVALKILRPSRQSDRIASERFQEEMRLMSGFKHPGIVRIFGTGEINQLPYMVAEFADAGSIASLLLDNTINISPRQAAWIVGRIAEAVEEAHSTPILHRDIKPGNILLRTESPERSEGLGLWPLLTDFGLSKNLSPQSGMPLTFEGEILGTLSYMSPEQVRGQSLKTQSDLFPLGVILHELAHGQHPFLAESDYQTRNNIVTATPSKPLGLNRRVPPSLDAIIAKCLQKKPEDRYLHASDLAKDLNHFLSGEPISVSPPSPWLSAVRWAGNHPIASTFLGTTLCFIIGSILLLSREWQIEWELAKHSQALADDRAKISQLFLESMRATNSGINDTILAGQRVLPSALLETLDRQIPLLEDALALEPNDHLLMRQLEIMYHYKSLCHINKLTLKTGDPYKNEITSQAIRAREKSLEYLDQLIQRFPDEEQLQVSRINGIYFMSTLVEAGPDTAESENWVDKGIANAKAFLKTHPDNLHVHETANCLRLHRCVQKGATEPEFCLQELGEIIDINLFLISKNPSSSSAYTYASHALFLRSLLFLDLGREVEFQQSYARWTVFNSDHRDVLQRDWNFLDTFFEGCFQFCESLLGKRRFTDAKLVAESWQSIAESLPLSGYFTLQGRQFKGSEMALIFPLFFRWVALSHASPDSEELAIANEKFREAIIRASDLSPDSLDVFIDLIKGRANIIQTIDEFHTIDRFVASILGTGSAR